MKSVLLPASMVAALLFNALPANAQPSEEVVAYLYVGCVIENYCTASSRTSLDLELLNLKQALGAATELTCAKLRVGENRQADLKIAKEVSLSMEEDGGTTCMSSLE